MIKVLFIGYDRPDSNSAIHIFNLANRLADLGVQSVVAVPGDKRAVDGLGPRRFEILEFADLHAGKVPPKLDLIHAWTPRERVRQIVAMLRLNSATPYVVHLEDNEEAITSVRTGLPPALLRRIPARVLDFMLRSEMAHPRRFPGFLAGAAGITVIIEALGSLCPQDVPRHLLWAGYEEGLPWDMQPDTRLRRRLNLNDGEPVISYTGNAHAGNWREVGDLYGAIHLLRERGIPASLVRTGLNFVRGHPGRRRVLSDPHAVELGFISRASVPAVVSIADVLVQPGQPGPFSDFRFPSKLPEFLASGRPVVLPRTNIGLHLKDGEECLLLESGSPKDIADKIQALLENPGFARAIGARGKRFAQRHLRWGQLAKGVKHFYDEVLGNPRRR
jgi:glycosyltransferase involved in cell wall biosynthesis